MITTKILLNDVEYGVPSGNYDGSSLDWVGNAEQGPGYYLGHSGQQTFTLRLTAFTGQLTIQGTLDSDPEHANWVTVYDFTDTNLSTYFSIDRTASFVWLRVRVQDFDAGSIDQIDVVYP
jgi:hypothetical protein